MEKSTPNSFCKNCKHSKIMSAPRFDEFFWMRFYLRQEMNEMLTDSIGSGKRMTFSWWNAYAAPCTTIDWAFVLFQWKFAIQFWFWSMNEDIWRYHYSHIVTLPIEVCKQNLLDFHINMREFAVYLRRYPETMCFVSQKFEDW